MSKFFEILAGIPINPVLREQAVLHEKAYILRGEEIEKLTKQVDELKNEVMCIKKENKELLKKLSAQSESKQFVEYEGAYFKKNHKGEFENVVYCPKCKQSTFDKMRMFHCLPCHWASPFKSYELPRIIKELNNL